MRKILLLSFLLLALLQSCSRGITPYQAAHGKAGKCGSKHLK
jgi:hypothetical protein